MSNYWSENGDILVHDCRTPLGWLTFFAAIASVPLFFVSVWVGIVGDLTLWSMFVLHGLTAAVRTEFDRGSRTMRRRSPFGRSWTDRLDPFTAVQVGRAMSVRGTPQLRVSLMRGDPPHYSDVSGLVVAVYALPGEYDEKEARKWGDRLARFLNLPLKLDL